eukprot:TRINITY_DN1348_c0_g2_i1.p1 TRINITY_DN1348_c0_g2~~TRINITY_DN1348_c0_g2_i1.p1  ORF type:complete len:435 (-),score=172.93 TRINITY_DN1348_c0_g2_i1:15-1217(-)
MRPQYWECDKCNFQNALDNDFCEECESWTCLSCTMKNRLGVKDCGACAKERPSDLQMKMHRELEAKRRALEEAEHQNAALNKRLMERQQQQQQQQQPQQQSYYPMNAFMNYEEAPRAVQDVGLYQAAPPAVHGDSPQECVEMDNLKLVEPKVELRSVVSDGAIIVYDTPEGPPEMSELMGTPEQQETPFVEPENFDVFRTQTMNSIVSDSVPIHFDDAPAAPAPNVIFIDVPEQPFFPEEPVEDIDGDKVDDKSVVAEETQAQDVEDMLHLGVGASELAPLTVPTETAETEEEEQQYPLSDEPGVEQEPESAHEEEAEEEQEEQDDVSEAGTRYYYTGTDLLQFLMESNSHKIISDESLEKLMKQVRENSDDKQTLLESLDACQGNSTEFFRMCRLMGFI